jgi:flagellar biosynthesis protein FliR
VLITEHQVMAALAAFFWPFTRLTGAFLTAPVLGNAVLPVPFRVALSALLAGCLAAWGGPWPPLPNDIPAIALYGFLQITFGAGIGLVGQIIVSAIASAGEVASYALGMNFATLTAVFTNTAPPVLYDVFYWIGLLVYLGLGGPFWIMEAVQHSFASNPLGIPTAISLRELYLFGGTILTSSVTLALPVLAAGLALNAVTGLANALSPQLNIFSIGFPLLFLGGIWVLALSIFSIEPVAVDLFRRGAAALGAWSSGHG